MPFASPASLKHGEKLIKSLAAVCSGLFVVGDARLDLNGLPPHVVRQYSLPRLHYLGSKRPVIGSATLWSLKLTWILMAACRAVFATRRQVSVVLLFPGTYSTPILTCARLLHKKSIIFWVNSDVELAEAAYRARRGGRLLVRVLGLMEDINRKLVDICAVEFFRVPPPLQPEPYRSKVRRANLFVDTEFYRVTMPFEDRSPVVGFVGRLSPGKGILQLLAAAESLHGSGITFEIIGDGPLRGEVEALLQRPNMQHVKFLGWTDAEAIVRHLNGFRLLVLPSEF